MYYCNLPISSLLCMHKRDVCLEKMFKVWQNSNCTHKIRHSEVSIKFLFHFLLALTTCLVGSILFRKMHHDSKKKILLVNTDRPFSFIIYTPKVSILLRLLNLWHPLSTARKKLNTQLSLGTLYFERIKRTEIK